MMFKIAPSILSADFSRLGDEIKKVEVEGTGYLHVDVMDGVFVPNITIGAPVVKAIKKVTKLPLDVHLMIVEPQKHIEAFAKAGADVITVHVEAIDSAREVLQMIRALGVKAGISIKPGTPVNSIKDLLEDLDLVLVMTVEPGFGGQKMIPSAISKIKEVKDIKDSRGLDFIIEVDGGVTEENIHQYVSLGAELVVAGNAVFAAPDPAIAIKNLISKGIK